MPNQVQDTDPGNYDGSIYAFEGVDGVGKSTAAQSFADEIDAELRKCPSSEFDSLRDYFNSDDLDTQSRFLFYLTANSTMSDEIEELAEQGIDVVVDRYYPGTVAYHEVESDVERDFWEMTEPFDFVEPDKIFYLWADEEVRLDRLADRKSQDHSNEDNSEYMEQVRAEYEKIAETKPNMVEVEAVDGVDNVVDRLMEEVD